MAKIVFKCLRCGHCCRNLLREFDGDLKGLVISPNERKLFPKKLISPRVGIGWGLMGPKHVVSYQLDANACPRLSKDNLCKIYNKRPLVCQAFPFFLLACITYPIGNKRKRPTLLKKFANGKNWASYF